MKKKKKNKSKKQFLLSELKQSNSAKKLELLKKTFPDTYYNVNELFADELTPISGQKNQLLFLVEWLKKDMRTIPKDISSHLDMLHRISVLCSNDFYDYPTFHKDVYQNTYSVINSKDLKEIKKILISEKKLNKTEAVFANFMINSILSEFSETDSPDISGCIIYLELIVKLIEFGIEDRAISYLYFLTDENEKIIDFRLNYTDEIYYRENVLQEKAAYFYVKWDTISDFNFYLEISKRKYNNFTSESQEKIAKYIAAYEKEKDLQTVTYLCFSVFEKEIDEVLISREADENVKRRALIEKINYLFLEKDCFISEEHMLAQKNKFNKVRVIRNEMYHGKDIKDLKENYDLLTSVLLQLNSMFY